MGVKTGVLIQCRGCPSEHYVDLKQLEKPGGEMGRFYYTHPKPIGCGQYERFDPDIDNTDDLAELVPGIVLKGNGVPAPILKEPVQEIPLKENSLKGVPDFGHGEVPLKETEPEPLKDEVPDPVPILDNEDATETSDKKGAYNEFGLEQFLYR